VIVIDGSILEPAHPFRPDRHLPRLAEIAVVRPYRAPALTGGMFPELFLRPVVHCKAVRTHDVPLRFLFRLTIHTKTPESRV
jgi:hypothetical protein